MAASDWSQSLNESEYSYLPLVSTCLLVVILLSALRDVLLVGLPLPSWLLVVNAAALTLGTAASTAVRLGKVAPRHSNLLVALLLIAMGSKAISAMALTLNSQPLYLGVVLFGCGLALTSLIHMIAVHSIIMLAWILVALQVVPTGTVLSGLGVTAIASTLSLIVLRKRVETLEQIYRLKKRVHTLETILPMCSNCKKTRDEEGNWKSVETYIEEHEQGLMVSHGICPDCRQELYGDLSMSKKAKG